VAELRTAFDTPDYAAREDAILVVFNAGDAAEVRLPPVPKGQVWVRHIDSAAPDASAETVRDHAIAVAEQSVTVLVLERPA